MPPADSAPAAFDAIILAGGRGRRLGGTDKALATVGGHTLLDRALDAVDAAGSIVVVGPPRPAPARVLFTREEPAGSGPAAAIAHAVGLVTSDAVVVLAVDVPFAKAAIPRLLAALPGHDAAMLADDGRRQPLIAAYASAALRARVVQGPAASWADRSVRSLVEPFTVAQVASAGIEALDCDTPDDLHLARHLARHLAQGQLGSGCSADESS